MVEYKFYTDEFCGKAISEEDWRGREAFASAYIRKHFVGFDVNTDDYKHGICAVAEAKQTVDQGVLESQTVGSWSKHYSVNSVSDKDRLLNAAMLYLSEYRKGVEWA